MQKGTQSKRFKTSLGEATIGSIDANIEENVLQFLGQFQLAFKQGNHLRSYYNLLLNIPSHTLFTPNLIARDETGASQVYVVTEPTPLIRIGDINNILAHTEFRALYVQTPKLRTNRIRTNLSSGNEQDALELNATEGQGGRSISCYRNLFIKQVASNFGELHVDGSSFLNAITCGTINSGGITSSGAVTSTSLTTSGNITTSATLDAQTIIADSISTDNVNITQNLSVLDTISTNSLQAASSTISTLTSTTSSIDTANVITANVSNLSASSTLIQNLTFGDHIFPQDNTEGNDNEVRIASNENGVFLLYKYVSKALWDPSYISTDVWLDASNEDNFTLQDTNRVFAWNDLSGNNHHATVVDATDRPTLTSNPAAVYFENSGGPVQYMTLGDILKTSNTVGLTLLMVVRNTNPTSITRLIAKREGGTSENSWAITPNSSHIARFLYHTTQSNSGGTSDSNRYYIVQTRYTPNGTSSIAQIGVNGIRTNVSFSSTNPTPSSTPVTLARETVNTTLAATMYLSELIAVTSALPTSEIEIIEGYLAHKWDLEDNLPANHPYRNEAPLYITPAVWHQTQLTSTFP